MKRFFAYKDELLMPLARLIPNAITSNHVSLVRLLLPLPVALLLLGGFITGALAVFVFGIITDFLDGPLARLRKQQSPSGELLDALADKLFFSVPFLILGATMLPTIVYLGIALVELATLLGGFVTGSIVWLCHGRYWRIKGETLGKIKMAFYFIATVVLLMPSVAPTFYIAALALYTAGFFLAVVSLTGFLLKFAKEL